MSLFWELFPADVHSLRLLLAENRETDEFDRTLLILESLLEEALIKVSREPDPGDSEVVAKAVEQFKTRITNGTGRYVTRRLLLQRLMTAKKQIASNHKKLYAPNQGGLGLKRSMQEHEFFEFGLFESGGFSGASKEGDGAKEDLILAKTVVAAFVLISSPASIFWLIYSRRFGARHGVDAEIARHTSLNVTKLSRERVFRGQVWGEIDELTYDPEDDLRNDSRVKSFFCSLVQAIRETKHKWRDAEGNADAIDWYEAVRLGGECLIGSNIERVRNNELSHALARVKASLDFNDDAMDGFVALFREIEEVKPLEFNPEGVILAEHSLPRTLDWLQRLPRRREPVIPFSESIEKMLRVKESPAIGYETTARPESESQQTNRQKFVSLIFDGLEEFEKRNLLDFLFHRLVAGDSIDPMKIDGPMPQLFGNLVRESGLNPEEIYPEEDCDAFTSQEILEDWKDIRQWLDNGEVVSSEGQVGERKKSGLNPRQPDVALLRHPPGELLFGSDPKQELLDRVLEKSSAWSQSPGKYWQPDVDEHRLIMISSVLRAFHQTILTYRPGGQ
jgi:hypothetical protein